MPRLSASQVSYEGETDFCIGTYAIASGVCSGNVVNLSADILAFKSNNTAFHISGQYPDWQQKEISRNIRSKNWRTAIPLTSSALVLGKNSFQTITTTDDYGEMKATDLAAKVQNDIQALPEDTKVRYIAPLNQVWLLSGLKIFPFLDVEHVAFFKREYNSPALDACAAPRLSSHDFVNHVVRRVAIPRRADRANGVIDFIQKRRQYKRLPIWKPETLIV